MSRHEIPAHGVAHKVIVGWDRPLLTYFVQVIDRQAEREDSDKRIVLWKGTRPREIYEIDQLANLVRPYADLTPKMRSTLYGDKDEGR